MPIFLFSVNQLIKNQFLLVLVSELNFVITFSSLYIGLRKRAIISILRGKSAEKQASV